MACSTKKGTSLGLFKRLIVVFGTGFASIGQAAPQETVGLLKPVIVSALRQPSSQANIAENTVIYTREDLKALPGKDLGEVLEYIPDLDVQTAGGFGQASSLSINGAFSRQVLLMVDGIPVNHQISGQANPARLPLSDVDRIEIIKGPSSSVWGSSLGGVVNIITRDPIAREGIHGHVQSLFAEFKTFKRSLVFSGRRRSVGYFISADFMRSDGTRPLARVEEEKFFGKLQGPVGQRARWTASFGYSGGETRDGVRPDGLTQVAPYISRYGKLAWTLEGDRGRMVVEGKYHDQDINTNLTLADSNTVVTETDHESLYRGLSVRGSRRFRRDDLLAFGMDFNWHRVKSTNLFDRAVEVSEHAPYILYSWRHGRYEWIPALRFDHNQFFGSQWSPSLGGIYHLSTARDAVWRWKVSRAFQAPPVGWIYNNDPSVLVRVAPNPDLKAERGIVYETGLQAPLGQSLDLRMSFYWAEVRDAISNETTSDGLVRKVNKDRFRRQTVDLDLTYTYSAQWVFGLGGSFKHVVDRVTGQIVRDSGIARQRIYWRIRYRPGARLSMDLFGHYRRWSSSPSQANDRKVILDARIVKDFQKGGWRGNFFLNVYNLTNSPYWAHPTYPSPRRYFEGGIRCEF